MTDIHVAVVGAYGSAGVAAAEGLADVDGVRLTLVDDGDPGGGLCILRGCMPSKDVLSAAAHRYQARTDGRLGDPPAVDAEAVVETKAEHVSNFAAHRRAAVERLAERENVEFHRDTARFVDGRTLAVGDREVEADYVVVATGSSVNAPDVPGVDEVPYLTSADVLDATEFPDSGVVMGFGYVGLELAPYLSEVGGVDLTVVEHDDRPLDDADPRFGDAMLDLYREEFGVDVVTNARERSVEPTDDGGVRVHLDGDGPDAVEADALYVFTGRRPNLSGLGLEHTALDPGEGWVRDTMQARDDDRTFVVGDAAGERMILHMAKEEGYLAAENVLAHANGEALAAYDPVDHFVVFSGASVYPYAKLGLRADEAREAGHDPVVVSRNASDDGVFETKDAAVGLASLVVARDGTVLGYEGFHYQADTMAKTMQVIVERGMDVRDVPDRAYHPTTPELLDGLFRDAKAALDG